MEALLKHWCDLIAQVLFASISGYTNLCWLGLETSEFQIFIQKMKTMKCNNDLLRKTYEQNMERYLVQDMSWGGSYWYMMYCCAAFQDTEVNIKIVQTFVQLKQSLCLTIKLLL